MPQREEESLIDEMREAIRGDRERAAARSGRIPTLEHEHEHEHEHEPEPEPGPEPEAAAPKPLFRRLLGR